MKKAMIVLLLAGLLAMGAVNQASAYSFTDDIDKWGLFGVDSAPLVEGIPFIYTHDLAQEVNFARGDYVTSATLYLDFTNDRGDTNIFGVQVPALQEYVRYAFDGSAWQQIGQEVDNGVYPLGVDVSAINNDGKLLVTIEVFNYSPAIASIWLDESRLTGEATAVPEPSTLLLLGVGFTAFAGYRMRRRGRV